MMLKNRFPLTADRNTVYINEWLDTLVSMRGDLINTNGTFLPVDESYIDYPALSNTHCIKLRCYPCLITKLA